MNLNEDNLSDLQGELRDLMAGYAGGQVDRAGSLASPSWTLAAWLELLRRHPLVSAMRGELLQAVAWGQIDPNAVAREVQNRLRELEADEREEGAQGTTAAPAADDRDMPLQARDLMLATIALIARDELGVPTLETRKSDSLDFYDCGVWAIRKALIEAYIEGWHASA